MENFIGNTLQEMSLEDSESYQGLQITKHEIYRRVVRALQIKNECNLNSGENVGVSGAAPLPLPSSKASRQNKCSISSSDPSSAAMSASNNADVSGRGDSVPKAKKVRRNDVDCSAMLPKEGFVRVRDILRVIPIGKSSWWDGVRTGRYPKPIKLAPKTTVWRVDEIRKLIEAPMGELQAGPAV